jgi:hypothetical protein
MSSERKYMKKGEKKKINIYSNWQKLFLAPLNSRDKQNRKK